MISDFAAQGDAKGPSLPQRTRGPGGTSSRAGADAEGGSGFANAESQNSADIKDIHEEHFFEDSDSYPDFFVWTADSDDDANPEGVAQRGKRAVAARAAAVFAASNINFDSG